MKEIIVTAILLLFVFCIRIVLRRRLSWSTRAKPRREDANYSLMIVLGSGGHTSEMMRFLFTLDFSIFGRVVFIVADTDKDSDQKARDFMATLPAGARPDYQIRKIPRTREVGQSYFSSIFSTIKSLMSSLFVMLRERPDLILANGPGTCVPICFLGVCFRMFGIHNTLVVLSESYACVKHLSLTARIMHRLVDVFFVQWPALLKLSPTALYSGRLPFTPGAASAAAGSSLASANKSNSSDQKLGYVLVTVGSTKFDDLIQSIDSVEFAKRIRALGYSGIHVQRGRGQFIPSVLPKFAEENPGFDVNIFEITTSWTKEVGGASLVIGHAGAGTILDSLEQSKPIIVVPNTKLMNNHQMDIAEELANRGYLTVSGVSNLLKTLEVFNIDNIKPFPQRETSVFRNTIEKRLGLRDD